MKKDLRNEQDWRVRAHFTPTSGPLPPSGSGAERLDQAWRGGGAQVPGPAAARTALGTRRPAPAGTPGLSPCCHLTSHSSELLLMKEQVMVLAMFSVVIWYLMDVYVIILCPDASEAPCLLI